jgi:hypothetical protein
MRTILNTGVSTMPSLLFNMLLAGLLLWLMLSNIST